MELWLPILATIVIVALVILFFILVLPKLSKATLDKLQAWLLYAVTSAEAELGEKTGQLKLVWVYDLFVERYPFLSTWIRYETFSAMVDVALGVMANMLEANDTIATAVYGESPLKEVAQ